MVQPTARSVQGNTATSADNADMAARAEPSVPAAGADPSVPPAGAEPSAPAADQDRIPLEIAARAAEADLPTGEEKTALVRSMFDAIAPRYDLVNRLMTFGLDIRWRKQSVEALALPVTSRVLDIACGTGDFLRILRSEGLRPMGLDLSWGMLAANRTGEPVAQADVSALPVADGSVDGITAATPSGISLICGPHSVSLVGSSDPVVAISLLEVAEPEHGLLLLGHRTWFRHVVPVIGGLLSDSAAYRYLPKSTALPAPHDRAAIDAPRRRVLFGQPARARRAASAS